MIENTVALSMIYLYRKIVAPIKVISSEVKRYVDNEENEEGINEKLKNIKTNDELEELSENILKLEEKDKQ